MIHRSPRSLLRLSAPLLGGLLAGLLSLGCASVGSSPEAEEIYAAAPWSAPETLNYHVVDIEGAELGSGVLEAAVDGDLLALHQRYEGASGALDDVTVWVDPATLRPQRGERTSVHEGETDHLAWTYGVNADGEPVLTVTEGDDEDVLRLRDHYYDNESSLWLWRAVAFEAELDTHYLSVNALERSQQTVNLRLPQTETVTVPAGEFEAYRLLFRTGRAVRTAWIEAAPPHRVLRWDNGSSVLELVD